MEKHHKQVHGPAISRLGDLMAHINRYQFNGVSRLAKDIGVADSTISRLLHGKINPSYILVERITAALEREVGHPIHPRDIFSEFGRFLTKYACDVMGCHGCLPEAARDETNAIRPEFAGVLPGKWVCSNYPNGYQLTTNSNA